MSRVNWKHGRYKRMLTQMCERRQRLVKIEELMLRGVVNTYQIAARFGVSQPVAYKDVQEIRKAWLESAPNNTKERRGQRIRQLEFIVQLAHDSFLRSREDAQTHTVKQGRICDRCEGLGVVDTEWCPKCEGDGHLPGEVTIQTKGQAGDPAYLGIAKECLKEISMLEGNHAPKRHSVRGRHKVEGQVAHGHLHAVVANEYADAPADDLIAARSVLLKLEQHRKAAAAASPITVDEKEAG